MHKRSEYRPRSRVEDIIAGAAREYTIYSRSPNFDDVRVGGYHVNYATSGEAVTIYEPEQRNFRPSTLVDLYDLGRLVDTLDNIHQFGQMVIPTELEDAREGQSPPECAHPKLPVDGQLEPPDWEEPARLDPHQMVQWNRLIDFLTQVGYFSPMEIDLPIVFEHPVGTIRIPNWPHHLTHEEGFDYYQFENQPLERGTP